MTSGEPGGKASILIVDDNATTRRLLAELLGAEGYRLLIARAGAEALRIVEQVAGIALIILDIMMPGMDGLEVCRRLRSRRSNRYVPIILATALDSEAHLAEGLAAGADDYVTKPFNQTEILARVRAALRLKRAMDELLDARELAAVGAIAVLLGHEINNPLAIVSGNLELVLRTGGVAGEQFHRLQAAREAAIRIRGLVQRLVRIRRVAITRYIGSVPMLDLDRSCTNGDEAPSATDPEPTEER